MLPQATSVIHAAPHADGQLELEVVEAESGLPIAARVHLKSTRKRTILLGLPGTSEHGDHFYIDGKLVLPLRVGQYTMEIEAGSEYRTVTSQPFEIERHADDTKRVEMPRFANLNEEGWWAGDLDVTRPLADLPLAMKAEGINLVPAAAPPAGADAATRRKFRKPTEDAASPAPSANQFIYGPRAVLDERAGGGLLLFDVQPPLDLSQATPYSPTSLTVIHDAHKAGGHVIARTPYAWDLPVWLVSGELDAIQLIHHHSLRNNVDNQEDDGRPRDRGLFPGPSGNGRWSEAIYYHVLNCGLRIPPAAGSGTGANDSPLGNNRVYVYCGEDFSYEQWWEGLDAGRVFVTNGPLLRPKVQGRPPGHVFSLAGGETLSFEIGLDLATRTPVEYLQIIQNGRVAAEVRLADWKGREGKLPPVVFEASGWFLVRAVTNNHRTYQFASSGPYYVEQAGKPRVSGRSVQFFLDWIEAAQERIAKFKDISDADRASLLAEQELARRFFEDILATANAE
jgi:hypothetical protein